jgi:endonuclease/exonuclease/phosphatase family metal-dependent hydrolase
VTDRGDRDGGDGTDPPSGVDGVRVCSYNVRYAGADQGSRSWTRRRDAVAGVVRLLRPDVLATQEVWLGMLDDLRERLPGYAWVGRPDKSGEQTPVGYRRDRFCVIDEGRFNLSETPDDPGSVGWDATYPRAVTHATLTDRRTGARFAVASAHLDHEGDRARREGARLLAAWVRDRRPLPAVVAGDLNCLPGSVPYGRLVDDGAVGTDDGPGVGATVSPPAGEGGQRDGEPGGRTDRDGDGHRPPLTDARSRASFRHGPTSTYTGFEAPDPGRVIDHVLITPDVGVHTYAVATDRGPDGGYPSDHLPVVADLQFG